LLALLCIASFFVSTIAVELFGSHQAVAQLKSLIVMPGLWILIPAMAVAGASGMFLGKTRSGRQVDAKKRRMPLITANGLLVLVPCAMVLNSWASSGNFDSAFYIVQVVELLAGATNLSLMGLNVRDGLRLAGRLKCGRGG
jgi:hypothetical protein